MSEALAAAPDHTRSLAAAPPRTAPALPALLRCPEPDPLCPCHGGAPAAVAAVTASTGLPLDPATRLDMQARFGHDFGQVRVHTDQAAAASAHLVNALAYTVGPHIAFAAGRYAPGTRGGDRLLAHELAHVVQQGDRDPRAALRAAAQPRSEQPELDWEADAAADAAMAGRRPVLRLASPGGLVQRQPATPAPATAGSAAPAAGATTPAPARLAPGISVTRKQDVRMGDKIVDATLTIGRGHGDLMVEVRAAFDFKQSKRAWTQSEKQAWQDTFVKKVSAKWSTKHYLVPTEMCPDVPVPLVAVRVKCVPVPKTTRHHIDIDVYRDEAATETSAVTAAYPPTQPLAEMNLRESDIRPDSSGYVTAEHEFGHTLGLEHIACASNAPECYGRGDVAGDIMGQGPTVSSRDYGVFADLLHREFAPGCRWVVKQASTEPHNMLPLALGVLFGVSGVLLGGALGFAAGGPLGALIGAGIGGAVVGGGMGLLFRQLGLYA